MTSEADTPTLTAVVDRLRGYGARQVRVVVDGAYDPSGSDREAILLEVEIAYDHWDLTEFTRRFLETLGCTVRWHGRDWPFDARLVRDGGDGTAESVVVYDRDDERLFGEDKRSSRL